MSANYNNTYGFKAINPISIFFFLGLILLSFLSPAQNPEPVYRRYTVDDGLPSSTVYHVFQDSKGYMWFATANGVSRFDGYKFENFDIQSGLVDNDVFEIFEDYKHRIWFIPMSGKLCYYENGKIVSYKFNNKISEHIPISRGPIKCSFYVDSLDYVYLSFRRFNRIIISPEGILKEFNSLNKEISIQAKELSNNKILVSSSYLTFAKFVCFEGLYQNFKITMKELSGFEQANHYHLFFISQSDSSMIMSLSRAIVKLKNGKIISKRKINEDIIWMSIDDDRNFWVALQIGGLYCFKNGDIEKEPQKSLLSNYKITSVLKDNEGAYWFSSLNDGVFYSSDINFVNLTKENGLTDNRINAVDVSQDGAYIGYEYGFVDLLKSNSVKHFIALNKRVKNPSVRRFFIDTLANRVWISSIVNLYWIQNDFIKELPLLPNMSPGYPKNVFRSRFGGYWIASTRGLAKIENDKIVYESYSAEEFTGLIYDLVEDYQGNVWFCTINGLWKYSKGVYQYLGTNNPLLSQTTYSLAQNPNDSSLWIGTNGAGIIVKKHNKVIQITKEDGLISNSVNQLYYTNNNMWVATRQGLSQILLDKENYTISNFTTANGLPTNEVTSVCENKGVVYVGTPKGLSVFNKKTVSQNINPPKVIISNLRVNNNEIDLLSKEIELDYDQNSLNIDFVGFVYRNAGNVNYRYRMLGIDTVWVHTHTPNCLFNGLSNGHYTFEVEAQSYDGTWSSTPAAISFTINPPFWKRLWFLVLGAITFTCVIYAVYKVRINSIHRRNDLIQNINLYKQQSLRQQMNPHFIFNTLNSIQLYILEKDPISSHRYLTKFARLMRMTLDNSLNPTIPLRDEIEALKLYLDLEKLRFEDRFEYTIDFGTASSILNYKIPTLLIQPFVENAIWHGISLKQDQMGWVKIKLIDNDKTLTCSIEDNGVGRQQAGEIRQMKNKEHKSRGSQITQQRIDLLSLMYKEKFTIYYDDLFDDHGNSLGTRVSIIIPKEI